jgi:Bacterial protein of unknown function (DUF853)
MPRQPTVRSRLASFNHLVGTCEYRDRHAEAELLGRFITAPAALVRRRCSRRSHGKNRRDDGRPAAELHSPNIRALPWAGVWAPPSGGRNCRRDQRSRAEKRSATGRPVERMARAEDRSVAGAFRHLVVEVGRSEMASRASVKKQKAASLAVAMPAHSIVVGKSHKYEVLDLKFGNRHGLVTGATGTGKTVTLQVIAEGFSCTKNVDALLSGPVMAADRPTLQRKNWLAISTARWLLAASHATYAAGRAAYRNALRSYRPRSSPSTSVTLLESGHHS